MTVLQPSYAVVADLEDHPVPVLAGLDADPLHVGQQVAEVTADPDQIAARAGLMTSLVSQAVGFQDHDTMPVELNDAGGGQTA